MFLEASSLELKQKDMARTNVSFRDDGTKLSDSTSAKARFSIGFPLTFWRGPPLVPPTLQAASVFLSSFRSGRSPVRVLLRTAVLHVHVRAGCAPGVHSPSLLAYDDRQGRVVRRALLLFCVVDTHARARTRHTREWPAPHGRINAFCLGRRFAGLYAVDIDHKRKSMVRTTCVPLPFRKKTFYVYHKIYYNLIYLFYTIYISF
jgi:hypothetical protein